MKRPQAGNSQEKGRIQFSWGLRLVLILAAAFLLGRGAGWAAETIRTSVTAKGSDSGAELLQQAEGSWGLSFQEDGKPPVADVTAEEIAKYNAWYMQDCQEKVLYLTFDAGYENGNTPAILDALKKHNAPAAFFIVGHYLESSPDLVRRMIDEGHIVGNHSYHHPDMSKMSKEEFQKELGELESLYQETFGREMAKYYRPPQGKYSEKNLQIAKELGYQTIFWSLAYVDWDVDQQPTAEEAMDKLTRRVHPGAIVLLHSTSKTNGEILDQLLTKWEEMGYTFRSLEELGK
ncbi:MAG: delta-lactam-biosynthetic de-N-acetylase [Lachnospiraceae bacterium]|nr:delta-lactam-biosynthetic de-N-acetylase [Lachnospiraceae bacterium]MCI9149926.1 delta-lactam-biosynthetic de-N-acetylase [Lachnospiraceae bacterium]